MDNMVIIIGFICLLFLWGNLYVSIRIIEYLKGRGEEASLFKGGFFIKGRIFSYLPIYRERTLKETGKVGSLYYLFYFTFFGLVLFFAVGVLLVA